MNISLSNEDIENHIKDALLKAGIGESIKTSVSKVLNSTYDNPIEKAIYDYVKKVAIGIIETKFSSEINAVIEDAIKAFIEKKGFEAILESLKNKLDKLDDGF